MCKYHPENDNIEVLAVLQGELTGEQKVIIKKATVKTKTNYGYPADESRIFFFVEKYYETNYLKPTKGALMGTGYIDLEEVDDYRKEMTAVQIAQFLDGKECDI